MRKIIIGKVYANWCGHCQHLKPEWLKMKKELRSKKMSKNCIFEFVEIEENDAIGMNNFKQRFPQLNVSGYPTIFKNNGDDQLEYYNGDRTSSEMSHWALAKPFSKFSGGKRKHKTMKRKKGNNKTLKNKK
jgi:thiol-disulfide isomerase/thioredoxin